jgi:hypothetical protein
MLAVSYAETSEHSEAGHVELIAKTIHRKTELTSSNDTSADDYADEHAAANTSPDLTNESLPDSGIMFRSKGLLQEGKKHRNNDASFQTLAKADEEDCNW